ncbi:MAG: DUF2256 domain-containing protein [Saprospirales bacterium]|nr:MAG: DUF2256 domain-containing protein [Saprospirales bacterium]
MTKKKSDLPEKICKSCRRPFAWRKKWERDWENVKYCSKWCGGERGEGLILESKSLDELLAT